MGVVGNRNIATASEALLVLAQWGEGIMDVGATSSAVTDAIFPLFGIRWNRDACSRVGGKWINGNICRLSNSNLPPEKILAVGQTI